LKKGVSRSLHFKEDPTFKHHPASRSLRVILASPYGYGVRKQWGSPHLFKESWLNLGSRG